MEIDLIIKAIKKELMEECKVVPVNQKELIKNISNINKLNQILQATNYGTN